MPNASQSQVFEDTWVWGPETERELQRFAAREIQLGSLLNALLDSMGRCPMMAYLFMMSERIVEFRRILRDTGSLYLHCDPTASHYLKMVCDSVFGPKNFRNEIIWRRTGSHNSAKRYGPVHDVILFYSKSEKYKFLKRTRPYTKAHVRAAFAERDGEYFTDYSGNVLTGSGRRNGFSGKPWRNFDPDSKGRHWAIPSKLIAGMEDEFDGLNTLEKLDLLYEKGLITIKESCVWPEYERKITAADGQYLSDLWAYQPGTEGVLHGVDHGVDADVRWMGTKDSERLGYPTQKPLGLLTRIIEGATKPGDVVFDPFCGCGTTVAAAETLGRQWIGVDIAHYAIELIEKRLEKQSTSVCPDKVTGRPLGIGDARRLAKRDPHQFQWWANWMIGVQVYKQPRGADGGIDGVIEFLNGPMGFGNIMTSVKAGKSVGLSDAKEIDATLSRSKQLTMAVLISLNRPSKPAYDHAMSMGFVTTVHGDFPRLQIITAEELIDGRYQLPPRTPTLHVRPDEKRRRRNLDGAEQKQLAFLFEWQGDAKRAAIHTLPEFDEDDSQAALL